MAKKDCASIEELLSALPMDGHLPEIRAAVERHLAGCESCRRFALLLENESELIGKEAWERLTKGVLERTTGATCDRAKEILPDWVDARLEGVDSEILTAHLRHCRACASISETLAELHAVLPGFALLDPGLAFTDSVMARTARRAAGRLTLAEKLRALWVLLAQRPRFALEAAYAGMLIFILLWGTPALPQLESVDKGVPRLSASLGEGIDSISAVIPNHLIESSGDMLRAKIRGRLAFSTTRDALSRPAAALIHGAQLRADAAADRIGETTRRLLSVLQRIREDMREEPDSSS